VKGGEKYCSLIMLFYGLGGLEQGFSVFFYLVKNWKKGSKQFNSFVHVKHWFA
jgi:hypothetical protein